MANEEQRVAKNPTTAAIPETTMVQNNPPTITIQNVRQ
jgi:hypothetical protein